jgi:hypothetical protein
MRNLRRYAAVLHTRFGLALWQPLLALPVVGRCRLNQVDP